jgi:hypothetical protein
LEAIGLEVSEQEEQAILRCGQGASLIDAKLARGTGLAIESPQRHVGLKGVLKRLNQLLKLVQGQAGQIEEFHWMRLHLGELDTRHGTCLLLGDRSIRGVLYHKSE